MLAGTAAFAYNTVNFGNTTGWLELNASQAAKYKLEGVPLSESKLAKAITRGEQSGYELPAGHYTFEAEVK